MELVAQLRGRSFMTFIAWHDVDFHGMMCDDGLFATFHCAEDACVPCHMLGEFGRVVGLSVEMI